MKVFVPQHVDGAPREFHISRRVREACGLSDVLFAASGNVVFADFSAARELAYRLNKAREAHRKPERAVSASRLHALGLIDEVLHLVVARHRQHRAPRLWTQVLALVARDVGAEELHKLLRVFVDEFPPAAVYRGDVAPDEYLAGATEEIPNREIVMEELVLLWLANRNPAFADFRELFDDGPLRAATEYVAILEHVETILGGSATGGQGGETLLDRLYAPMRVAPTSLEGQLEFIRTAWAELLGPELRRVLGGLDFLAEEQRVYFPPGGSPGPIDPPDYTELYDEVENYSSDLDWMPRLVLLAKNAHVWLAQLSAKYGRDIATLDGIPDEELAALARSGFTGLWLIGVWERSRASERIKKMMGDEDAVASAYSLQDYAIAGALGGEHAYEELKSRAWAHGIRLSTDMVPNHMGIDSRWVIEHPDWFLSVDRPPYPSYEFTGSDLCDDERVGVYIEDKYWSRSDAAVVFKRVDHHTGAERFIYHGNDGTSMPWNDTAQLDYTRADVREAVIQTILAVARRSPVIRFDAAMTLTRQHYHRLWFPEPGAAGAVPSRAEFGMAKAQFDSLMPAEFWREVVDRVAAEAPDTLLLAEAFWLLEGYFVRTLGMHRVYNSAFMNMLRDERNAEYRQLIRSTMEFDPQILKRYVNFMSNPDERTAVDQFGTGDKYFGVATLMATLPGLPMFGHGQIEGLAEKYGMEFRRPRWNETVDEGLVDRHRRQLFPLLRRRRIFAEVGNFLFFDFELDDHAVDEDVFVYANEVDGERSLVIYNNRFGRAAGRFRLSTGVAEEPGRSGGSLRRTTLAEGLRLPETDGACLIARDAVSGLEHIFSCADVRNRGLWFDLEAYGLHCFVDFREVVSDERHPWSELAAELDGRGVSSLDEAMGMRVMAPVLDPVRRLVDPELVRRLAGAEDFETAAGELRQIAVDVVPDALAAGADQAAFQGSTVAIESSMLSEVEALLALRDEVGGQARDEEPRGVEEPGSIVSFPANPAEWAAALVWVVAGGLGRLEGPRRSRRRARARFESWHLGSLLTEVIEALGVDRSTACRMTSAIEITLATDGDSHLQGDPGQFAPILEDRAGSRAAGVNAYDGFDWLHRESFESLVRLMAATASVRAVVNEPESARDKVADFLDAARKLSVVAEAAGYRVDVFLGAKEGEPRSGAPES